ncbi:VOC family protein [Streptomyces sp. RFCAC02]|uniref:VOC family protein n=1 Tax=Streptomyces sp. RFCAC02 TaxID=2499143 RepID=UPI00101F9630|nr:VOC family protein [Streptomyces sp. RFCAC02]
MTAKIFVNLPVKDLERSKRFFRDLGYAFSPQFTDENAACIVISEDIFVMLLTEPFFRNFTRRAVADTSAVTEAIVTLSADSRAAVDELVERALASGGSPSMDPIDEGPMYGRGFLDPDGHHWEVMYMDPAALQGH